MIPCWLTDSVTSDLDRALHYTLLWGLEGVELRSVGRPGDIVPFVNEARLKRRLAEAEIPVCAVAPSLFEGPASDKVYRMNEVNALEETLRFCRRIGCNRVVVSCFAKEEPEEWEAAARTLNEAGRRAAAQGIELAVLNGPYLSVGTGAELARFLERVDHPNVGAAWRPAAGLEAGEPPERGLAALSGRVMLVRCANIRRSGPFWEPAGVAEGEVDWNRQMAGLAAQGFNGPISLEVLCDPRPKAGLKDASRLIQLIRDAGK